MKKISTLMVLCLAMAFSSFAQDQSTEQGRGGYHNNNGGNYNGGQHGYGNGGYGDNNDNRYYNFRSEAELLRGLNLTRQQERRIVRINDDYRDRILRIQNNRWGNAQQKRYQVERLEQQRRQEIMNVLTRFQRDRYNNWCARNNNNYGNGGNGGYGNGRW